MSLGADPYQRVLLVLMLAHAAWDIPGGAGGKEPACQCRRQERCRFNPWVGRIPWRRAWKRTPGFLPGESHGQRGLVGYSQGHKESDTTDVTLPHAPYRMRASFCELGRYLCLFVTLTSLRGLS